jgi:hypothetical protein
MPAARQISDPGCPPRPLGGARRRCAVGPLLAVAGLLAGGCFPSRPPRDLAVELQDARAKIAQQNDQLAAQQATIAALTKQVDTLRGIPQPVLENIFYPVKLEIGDVSGGFDEDGAPGDDGVVVYLRPIDEQGDVIKAAGRIHIQLYDLAAPPGENLIGDYDIPVEQARTLWYGKWLTYHYAVRCPWPSGPPRHPEVTIRATFIDYLTGRVMSAQRAVTVKLPPRPAGGARATMRRPATFANLPLPEAWRPPPEA